MPKHLGKDLVSYEVLTATNDTKLVEHTFNYIHAYTFGQESRQDNGSVFCPLPEFASF